MGKKQWILFKTYVLHVIHTYCIASKQALREYVMPNKLIISSSAMCYLADAGQTYLT